MLNREGQEWLIRDVIDMLAAAMGAVLILLLALTLIAQVERVSQFLGDWQTPVIVGVGLLWAAVVLVRAHLVGGSGWSERPPVGWAVLPVPRRRGWVVIRGPLLGWLVLGGGLVLLAMLARGLFTSFVLGAIVVACLIALVAAAVVARSLHFLVELAALAFVFFLIGGTILSLAPQSEQQDLSGVQVQIKMADLANGPVPIRMDHKVTLMVAGVGDGAPSTPYPGLSVLSLSAADGRSVAYTGELPDSLSVRVPLAKADALLGALHDRQRLVYLFEDQPGPTGTALVTAAATPSPSGVTPAASGTPGVTPSATPLPPVVIPLPSERIRPYPRELVQPDNAPIIVLVVTRGAEPASATTQSHRFVAFVLACDNQYTWVGVDRGRQDASVADLAVQTENSTAIYLLPERPSESRPTPQSMPRLRNSTNCPWPADTATTVVPQPTATLAVLATRPPGVATQPPTPAPSTSAPAPPSPTAVPPTPSPVPPTPPSGATATLRPTTPPPSASPGPSTPSPTPPQPPTPPPAPPGPTPQLPDMPHDNLYFAETRFRVDPAVQSYFETRGGLHTFGFPISRKFRLIGCDAQVFQRQVVQLCANQIQLLNLLDRDIFPFRRVNHSTFPEVDDGLKDVTPQVGDPDYSLRIVQFVQDHTSGIVANQAVDFGQAYFGFISPVVARTSDPALLQLMHVEVWGAPTSMPTPDPGFPDFIYQRFQRGILQYVHGEYHAVLLAEYLKSLMLDRDVPDDLRADAATANSRFLQQYCPGKLNWLCRRNDLFDTDLTYAFDSG